MIFSTVIVHFSESFVSLQMLGVDCYVSIHFENRDYQLS